MCSFSISLSLPPLSLPVLSLLSWNSTCDDVICFLRTVYQNVREFRVQMDSSHRFLPLVTRDGLSLVTKVEGQTDKRDRDSQAVFGMSERATPGRPAP